MIWSTVLTSGNIRIFTCWQILFFADQVDVTVDDPSKETALKHEVFSHAILLYKRSNLMFQLGINGDYNFETELR